MRTDRQTNRHTHETTTVTLAAHVRRGLIRIRKNQMAIFYFARRARKRRHYGDIYIHSRILRSTLILLTLVAQTQRGLSLVHNMSLAVAIGAGSRTLSRSFPVTSSGERSHYSDSGVVFVNFESLPCKIIISCCYN